MDAEMAGILQRYFADFSFMFLAAVVLLVFIVNENLRLGTQTQQLLMKVLLALVSISVLYSVLVCFIPEPAGSRRFTPGRIKTLLKRCCSGRNAQTRRKRDNVRLFNR